YSQNATVFSKRLGALRKERKDLEFGANQSLHFSSNESTLMISFHRQMSYLVFVNAPHILLAAASEQLAVADTQSDPNTALRGWWKANKEKTKVEGLEESLNLIRDVLKEQRFDPWLLISGKLECSQGAAFAAVISALLERPHLYPSFLEDGKPLHPPFQFCVAVSGFRVKDPFCDPVFSQRYTTPTLHVLGRTDVVVVEERSRTLIDVSANARVEEHDGGMSYLFINQSPRVRVAVIDRLFHVLVPFLLSFLCQDTLFRRRGTGASFW
ncbi:hypothetical protein CVT25_008648, partial [Psilocybe cyanescens]